MPIHRKPREASRSAGHSRRFGFTTAPSKLKNNSHRDPSNTPPPRGNRRQEAFAFPDLKTFLPVQDYDLAATLTSGQAFRWTKNGHCWEGVIGSHAAQLEQTAGGILVHTPSPCPDWRWAENYLQTNVNLPSVIDTFPDDEPMRAAVNACRGLRLLRQEPWECLASFILSSTKQIVQIQQIVRAVCDCYGEPLTGSTLNSFPSAEKLSQLTEANLRACKMGFRAPYLLETARIVASGKLDLETLRQLKTTEARVALTELPGVGEKIANCVLLFAYGFQDAFPIDVWVQKALRQLYFPKRKPTQKRLINFIQTHFGPNAGYAQQYLFHYMRTKISDSISPVPFRPENSSSQRLRA